MDEYRRHLNVDIPTVVTEFFVTFSRFEFALKRGGFLKIGEIGSRAGPDWDEFAKALEPGFFAKMQTSERAEIFFKDQPKSLRVAAAQRVAFDTPDPIVNGEMLFGAVRLVRNNLFHGEKPRVTDRDQALMTASLFVLDSAMSDCHENERCTGVPQAFAFSQIQAD